MKPSTSPPAVTDSPTEPVDLGRLRIDRSASPVRRGRGFPFVRLWIVVGVLALLFLLRAPLLSLIEGGQGASWETALCVTQGGAGGGVMGNGYVVAKRLAALSTVLSGRLVELHAKEGDIVEEGAIVARIQFDDMEEELGQALQAAAAASARRAQAEAETTAAKARQDESQSLLEAARLQFARLEADIAGRRELADQAAREVERLEREVERNRPLHERKLIDAEAWDRVETAARMGALARDAARSRVRVSEAERDAWTGQVQALEQGMVRAGAETAVVARALEAASADEAAAAHVHALAVIQVEKTRIRAPFRGLVIRKDAELGEVLAPTGAGNSRGSVFTIVDPATLEMQIELNERRLSQVKEGDRARITLEATAETALPGVVRAVWPRADRSKGTVEVRVRFDPLPKGLKPDMAGRVEFLGSASEAAPAERAVLVPARAVVQREGRTVVFVVRDGVAQLTPVSVAESLGTQVRVSEGLVGGERVILSPPTSLSDQAQQP